MEEICNLTEDSLPAAPVLVRLTAGLSTAEQPLCSHPLPQPALPSSGSWQPTLPAESPGQLAQAHLLLPTLPTRSLTRLGFTGPVIPLFYVVYLSETLNSHRLETYCHMGFVSFYFYNH